MATEDAAKATWDGKERADAALYGTQEGWVLFFHTPIGACAWRPAAFIRDFETSTTSVDAG